MSTNSTNQQFDDILGNGSTDEILQHKNNLSNTQKINTSLSGLLDSKGSDKKQSDMHLLPH